MGQVSRHAPVCALVRGALRCDILGKKSYIFLAIALGDPVHHGAFALIRSKRQHRLADLCGRPAINRRKGIVGCSLHMAS